MREAIGTLKSLSTVRTRTDVLLALLAVLDRVVACVALLAPTAVVVDAVHTLGSDTMRAKAGVHLAPLAVLDHVVA